MKTLTVDLPGRPYDILIQRGLLDEAGAHTKAVCPKARRIFAVSDTNVAPLYGERVLTSLKDAGFEAVLHVIPAGEASKNPTQLAQLWEAMMEAGLTRTDAVLALGGGVIGDLSGFAAATILRGVDFIQVPTTLLAQVDSSVGGKTAVDLQHGKNLAGAFWQPKLVLMDPDTLNTLPEDVFMAGMAEVLKYGCIRDADFFANLEARPTRAALMEEIETILLTCCGIKRDVVLADERDTGVRMILNFGHTVGHAYEKAGNYEKWSHGQAVAAGMVAAAHLGVSLGITPADLPERIQKAVSALNLPAHIPCSWEDLTHAIALDKKGAGANMRVVLLTKMGWAEPVSLTREQLEGQLRKLWEEGVIG